MTNVWHFVRFFTSTPPRTNMHSALAQHRLYSKARKTQNDHPTFGTIWTVIHRTEKLSKIPKNNYAFSTLRIPTPDITPWPKRVWESWEPCERSRNFLKILWAFQPFLKVWIFLRHLGNVLSHGWFPNLFDFPNLLNLVWQVDSFLNLTTPTWLDKNGLTTFLGVLRHFWGE